jgi:hypothetical protein
VQTQAETPTKQAAPEQKIAILVNEREVVMVGHQQTGLQIKQAAISQGVPIQIDFVLSIEHGDHQTKIVADSDHVAINKNSRFVAIADDDNS